jgi:hypothetical protein
MHMSMAANAIEKRGTFKAYKEACEAYVEQREALKQAKAALALLTATVSKGEKMSKKSSKKVSEMALQKTKEGVALANAPALELHAEYQADYKKAKFATETAKNKHKATATKMFQFYANLLSADAKCSLTRLSRNRQRLIHSRIFKACPEKSQGDFCTRHSMTASCSTFSQCFQTRRLSKKILPFQCAQEAPEGWCTSVCTAHRAAQCLCCKAALLVLQPKLQSWYDTGENVPFTKADLTSLYLWRCPHQWQDQYRTEQNNLENLVTV